MQTYVIKLAKSSGVTESGESEKSLLLLESGVRLHTTEFARYVHQLVRVVLTYDCQLVSTYWYERGFRVQRCIWYPLFSGVSHLKAIGW